VKIIGHLEHGHAGSAPGAPAHDGSDGHSAVPSQPQHGEQQQGVLEQPPATPSAPDGAAHGTAGQAGHPGEQPGSAAATPAAQPDAPAGRPTPDLTHGQQLFIDELAGQTGLDKAVVTAWVHVEENGRFAASREHAGNHNWLNIGYTDSGPRPFTHDMTIWSDPVRAADATAAWLKGDRSGPVDQAGYHAAKTIHDILGTAGKDPQTQIHAIGHSGWASTSKYETAIQTNYHNLEHSSHPEHDGHPEQGGQPEHDGQPEHSALSHHAEQQDRREVGEVDGHAADQGHAPPGGVDGHGGQEGDRHLDGAHGEQSGHQEQSGQHGGPGHTAASHHLTLDHHGTGSQNPAASPHNAPADHGAAQNAAHYDYKPDLHADVQQAGAGHYEYAPDVVQQMPAGDHLNAGHDHHVGQSGQLAHHDLNPGLHDANPAHQVDDQSMQAGSAALHHTYDSSHSDSSAAAQHAASDQAAHAQLDAAQQAAAQQAADHQALANQMAHELANMAEHSNGAGH
jgi:hypothetical protein